MRLVLDAYALVGDTNVVLRDLDYRVRHGVTTALQRACRYRQVNLLLTRQVMAEITRVMPGMIGRHGPQAVHVAVKAWNESLAGNVRIVDVDAAAPRDVRIDAVADVDDRPTAKLAALLAPVHVLSNDDHLLDPGWATAEWLEVVFGAQAVVETEHQQRGLALFGLLAAKGVGHGLARLAGNPARVAIPTSAAVLLAIATVGQLLRTSGTWGRVRRATSEVVAELGDRMVEVTESRARLDGLKGEAGPAGNDFLRALAASSRTALHESVAPTTAGAEALALAIVDDDGYWRLGVPAPALRVDGVSAIVADRDGYGM